MPNPSETSPQAHPESEPMHPPERSQTEVIAALHELDLAPHKRTNLLLVYLGAKPAMELSGRSGPYQPGETTPEPGSTPSVHAAAEWAEAAGLPHQVLANTRSLSDGRQQDTLDLFVAHDDVRMAHLVSAYEDQDTRRFGEALGYPSTAATAFARDEGMIVRNLPEPPPPEIAAFAKYAFSAEHAIEELEAARRWSAAVREADPELFSEMVRAYQSSP
jgi:hypothetical protein